MTAPQDDPELWDAARRVLTDVEYLTWSLARKGISRTAIAYFRGVSKGTVNECLARAWQKIEEATSGEDRDQGAA